MAIEINGIGGVQAQGQIDSQASPAAVDLGAVSQGLQGLSQGLSSYVQTNISIAQNKAAEAERIAAKVAQQDREAQAKAVAEAKAELDFRNERQKVFSSGAKAELTHLFLGHKGQDAPDPQSFRSLVEARGAALVEEARKNGIDFDVLDYQNSAEEFALRLKEQRVSAEKDIAATLEASRGVRDGADPFAGVAFQTSEANNARERYTYNYMAAKKAEAVKASESAFMSGFRTNLEIRQAEIEESARDIEDPNRRADYTIKEMTKYIDEQLKLSESYSVTVQAEVASYAQSHALDVLKETTTKQRDDNVAIAGGNFDRQVNSVAAMLVGAPERLDDELRAVSSLMEGFSASLSPKDRIDLQTATAQKLYKAAMRGYVQAGDVSKAEALFDDPRYTEIMSADERQTFRIEAQEEFNKSERERDRQLSSQREEAYGKLYLSGVQASNSNGIGSVIQNINESLGTGEITSQQAATLLQPVLGRYEAMKNKEARFDDIKLALNQGLKLNGDDKETAEAAEEYFKLMYGNNIGSPQSMEFIKRTGYVPKLLKNSFEGAFKGEKDARSRLNVIRQTKELQSMIPGVMSQFSKSYQSAFYEITGNTIDGQAETEALQLYDEKLARVEKDPSSIKLAESLSASFFDPVNGKYEFDDGRVTQVFRNDPTAFLGFGVEIPSQMKEEHRRLVKSYIASGASPEGAMEAAYDTINQTWTPSKTQEYLWSTDNRKFIKNAPEKVYGFPYAEPDDNALWIKSQLDKVLSKTDVFKELQKRQGGASGTLDGLNIKELGGKFDLNFVSKSRGYLLTRDVAGVKVPVLTDGAPTYFLPNPSSAGAKSVSLGVRRKEAKLAKEEAWDKKYGKAWGSLPQDQFLDKDDQIHRMMRKQIYDTFESSEFTTGRDFKNRVPLIGPVNNPGYYGKKWTPEQSLAWHELMKGLPLWGKKTSYDTAIEKLQGNDNVTNVMPPPINPAGDAPFGTPDNISLQPGMNDALPPRGK